MGDSNGDSLSSLHGRELRHCWFRSSWYWTNRVPFLLQTFIHCLISFPRPTVRCFRPQDVSPFGINSVLQTGFDILPNISDPRARDHLIVQQRRALAFYKTAMEVCKSTMGDTLRYMGTSTIARDVDFITTVLEGHDALMYVSRCFIISDYFYTYSTVISGESVMVLFSGATLLICGFKRLKRGNKF